MTDKGRGGPRTEEGKAVALANLGDPELAAIKHGAHRLLTRGLCPPCDRCIARETCEHYREGSSCVLAEAYQADLTAELMALEHIQAEDLPLVSEYARLHVALAIIDHYLSVAGPFLPGTDEGYIEPQPVLARTRMAVSNSMVRLASELGLSPASRARLKTGGGDRAAEGMAKLFAEAEEITNKQRAEREAATVDGEFDETDKEAV